MAVTKQESKQKLQPQQNYLQTVELMILTLPGYHGDEVR